MDLKTIQLKDIDFNKVSKIGIGCAKEGSPKYFVVVFMNDEAIVVAGTETDETYKIAKNYNELEKLVKKPDVSSKNWWDNLQEEIVK